MLDVDDEDHEGKIRVQFEAIKELSREDQKQERDHDEELPPWRGGRGRNRIISAHSEGSKRGREDED